MGTEGSRIQGVLPALMTPYGTDGAVDLTMARRLVRHQLDRGCHGFFVCGSTGEGLLLTTEERKAMAGAVISEVAGQVPVMVHVGAPSTAEAVELARHARETGASAVSSLPPIYYRVGLEGMMQHIRAIAEAAAIPTYYYHIPVLTGVEISGDELIEAFMAVEHLAGFKYTHSDLFFLWWVVDGSGGRLDVFNGSDQLLFQGLCAGACGGVGSTYNYQTGTIVAVYEAFAAGRLEEARQAQARANAAIRVLFRFGANLACEKAIMKLKGLDVGPPRGPMVAFPEERLGALRDALEPLGILDA